MPTFLQIVERQREIGEYYQSGSISIKNLQEIYKPYPLYSVRALQQKMYQDWKKYPFTFAKNYPWAIILCRFKGLYEPQLENDTEQFFRNMFTPGTGGLVEYWRDVSFGHIDINGSQIFGWVELDIERKDASGKNRSVLIDYAVAAAKRDGLDPETGFHSQVAVFTHNFSIDGVPEGNPRDNQVDWQDPTWGKFFIDGSSDGKRVSAPPHGQNAFFLAHEMGHGFGMAHDLGSDLIHQYGDICCVMSNALPGYDKLSWDPQFGPAVCLPHSIQHCGMYKHRIYNGDDTWMSQPDGITLPLAPITDPGAKANLGITLAYKNGTDREYYLEYTKPTGRYEKLGAAYLIIRRMYDHTSVYLGSIQVPISLGTSAEYIEQQGNVSFKVERLDADGRIVKVKAKKL